MSVYPCSHCVLLLLHIVVCVVKENTCLCICCVCLHKASVVLHCSSTKKLPVKPPTLYFVDKAVGCCFSSLASSPLLVLHFLTALHICSIIRARSWFLSWRLLLRLETQWLNHEGPHLLTWMCKTSWCCTTCAHNWLHLHSTTQCVCFFSQVYLRVCQVRVYRCVYVSNVPGWEGGLLAVLMD